MPKVHTPSAHISDKSTAGTDVSHSGVGPKAQYVFLIQNTYLPAILALYRYASSLWCCNRRCSECQKFGGLGARFFRRAEALA